VTERDDEARLLREIADKGGVSIVAFSAERLLALSFSFVVTAGLGATVYGYLSVLRRTRAILDEVLTGLASGHSRTIPRYGDPGQRSVLFASLLLVVGLGGTLGAAVTALRRPIVARTLFEPRHLTLVTAFGAGLVPTVVIIYTASAFRAYRKVRRSVFVSRLARPGAVLLGTAAAITAGATGPTGVWLTVVAALTALAAVTLGALARETPMAPRLDRPDAIRDFLTYVGSTSLVGLLGASQRQVVFVLMAAVLSPVGAGVFSLSLLIGGIVRWPLKGVNRALSAIAAELHDDGETRAIGRLYRQTSRVAAFLTIPVIAVVVPHAEWILTAFSGLYGPGAPVLILAVAGQFLAVLAGSNGLLLLMTDNERPTALLHAVHAAVVLPVMVVLAWRHGVVGLGVAYGFSLAFNNATELWLLRYLEGVWPFTREHWLLAGCSVLVALAGSAVAAATPAVVSIPLSAVAGVCVAASAYRWLLPDADCRVVDVMLRRERWPFATRETPE
jgi:O-antigen/teichoic acid export membrane protein